MVGVCYCSTKQNAGSVYEVAIRYEGKGPTQLCYFHPATNAFQCTGRVGLIEYATLEGPIITDAAHPQVRSANGSVVLLYLFQVVVIRRANVEEAAHKWPSCLLPAVVAVRNQAAVAR